MRAEEIQIVSNVVGAMFPALDDTLTLVGIVSAYAAGQTNKATARCDLHTALQKAGINADDELLELCNDTAFELVCGFRHWITDQENLDGFEIYPARELKHVYERLETTNWLDKWVSNGGGLFQEDRMIAWADDPIWRRISAFNLPFPPFELGSGMDVEVVDRQEAAEMGLIDSNRKISPLSLDVDFTEALRKRVESYFSVEARRARWIAVISAASAEELLDLAEEQLEEIEDAEANAATDIAMLIERALQQGFGDSKEKQAEAYERIANIREALGENDEANVFRRRQIEVLEKWIAECIPSDGNQRARVCGRVADLHEEFGNPERAKHFRQLREDSRTPYSLFFEARSRVKAAGGMNAELAADVVADVNRALNRGFENSVFDEANALSLLVEAYDFLGKPAEATSCRLRQANALQALLAKGVPVESDSRSKVYRQLGEIFDELGDSDKATAFRQMDEENRDGFSLLDEVLHQIKAANGQIEQGFGAKSLDRLTRAVGKIPESCVEEHARIYRATGEILEALGDATQAVEYYEYAIQKNPRVGVKQRLTALKKKLGQSASRLLKS